MSVDDKVQGAIERLRLSSGFLSEEDGADVLMVLAEVERLRAERSEIWQEGYSTGLLDDIDSPEQYPHNPYS